MKQSFARALGLVGLAWGVHEKPVDRLTAMGAAQIGRAKPNPANVAQVRRAQRAQRQSRLASLGVDLIALKFARREISRRLAGVALAEMLDEDLTRAGREPIAVTRLEAIALWAIVEWAEDACPPRPGGCGGAGEVPYAGRTTDGAQRMMVCPKCKGTTRRRWEDGERAHAMGAHYEVEMAAAHRLIGDAESLAMHRGIRQLGRSSS